MRYIQLWPFHKLDIGRLDDKEWSDMWLIDDTGEVTYLPFMGRPVFDTGVPNVVPITASWQSSWKDDDLLALFNNYKEAMKKVVDENA